jgi:hypothetical protein
MHVRIGFVVLITLSFVHGYHDLCIWNVEQAQLCFYFLPLRIRTYWQSHLLPMDMKPKKTSTVIDLNF